MYIYLSIYTHKYTQTHVCMYMHLYTYQKGEPALFTSRMCGDTASANRKQMR